MVSKRKHGHMKYYSEPTSTYLSLEPGAAEEARPLFGAASIDILVEAIGENAVVE